MLLLSNWLADCFLSFSSLRLLSFPEVSRSGGASDWCALSEALYKRVDAIHYTIIRAIVRDWRIYKLSIGKSNVAVADWI